MNKIAVAIHGKDQIAKHFAECEGFDIFEIDNNQSFKKEFRPNLALSESHEKADSHQQIVQLIGDCKAVIGGGMGHRVASALLDAGIVPVIAANADLATDAVEKFLKGQLLIGQPHRCCHDSH